MLDPLIPSKGIKITKKQEDYITNKKSLQEQLPSFAIIYICEQVGARERSRGTLAPASALSRPLTLAAICVGLTANADN